MSPSVMSRRARTGCAIGLVALTGCVDAAHPFTRAIGPAVARAHRRAAAAERVRVAALPRVPEGQRFEAGFVSDEGGVRHVLVGPIRADLRGASVTPAEDVPPDRIHYALHGARGWLFFSGDGSVYTAPTFTGALRLLRTFGCRPPTPPPALPVARDPLAALENERVLDESLRPISPTPLAFPSVGRLALVSPDHREILWSDGDALHTLDVPGAVALAWQSASRGALIVGHESLSTTRDGGRTWRTADLRGATPVTVEGRADGLFVETDAGLLRIDERDALTPVAHTHPRAETPALLPTLARLYDRGYTPAPTRHDRCRPLPLRLINVDEPGFIVELPERTPRDGAPELDLPRGVAAPFGSPRGRAFADTSLVPAIVSVTRPDAPTPGHALTLEWRGADERSAFSMRVDTTCPREIPVTARWRVVAATRTALMVSITDDRASEAARYWFTATGARRLELALADGSDVLATALDDGGAALLTHAEHHRQQPIGSPAWANVPEVVCALRLAPDGAVRGRRCVAVPLQGPQVVGLGELDGAWGLVTKNVNADALTLRPLDGGERTFGQWDFRDPPHACGPRGVGGMRVHLLRPDPDEDRVAPFEVTIGPQFDGPDFADARLATYELPTRGAAPCLRRVWCTRRLEGVDVGGGQWVDERWGAYRINACNGELAGEFDDGARRSVIPAFIPRGGPVYAL